MRDIALYILKKYHYQTESEDQDWAIVYEKSSQFEMLISLTGMYLHQNKCTYNYNLNDFMTAMTYTGFLHL